MKSKLALLSAAITLILCSFIPKPVEVTIFDGVWQLKEFNYGGNKGSNPNPKSIKVFKDGGFAFYLIRDEKEQKTIGGKFRVLSDSVYSESIVSAVYTPEMIGQTYNINYKMEDGVLKMSGTYDSADGKVNYTETWIKIQSNLLVNSKFRSSQLAK